MLCLKEKISIGGKRMERRSKAMKPDQFYTSTEVRKKLGISSSTLTNLVERALIARVIPPGYKNGYYTKDSVDRYYEQLNLFIDTFTQKENEGLMTRKATEADQPGIFALEKEVYGQVNTMPLETRLVWYGKNPDMEVIATTAQRVVGHLTLMPLKPQPLEGLLRGEIRGWHIQPDDIEVYESGKQYNVFIMSAAVEQSDQESGSRLYAALLLRAGLQTLFEMAEQGKLIRRVYATSRSRDGIYLAQRMEFDILTEYSTARRKAFVLDMGKSNAKWAREYREWVASLKLPTNITEGILTSEGT